MKKSSSYSSESVTLTSPTLKSFLISPLTFYDNCRTDNRFVQNFFQYLAFQNISFFHSVRPHLSSFLCGNFETIKNSLNYLRAPYFYSSLNIVPGDKYSLQALANNGEIATTIAEGIWQKGCQVNWQTEEQNVTTW